LWGVASLQKDPNGQSFCPVQSFLQLSAMHALPTTQLAGSHWGRADGSDEEQPATAKVASRAHATICRNEGKARRELPHCEGQLRPRTP
ncbi:MAG: hypothetical protein M3O36_04935, partial [Myxococcota bacterium]|nr:hypothetical protein [Myxococcota bacterium]